MTPGLVNEIFAGMARRHDLGSAFAARHYVMSTRRNFSFTEHTGLGHKDFVRSIANQCSIENGGRSGNRTHDRLNLQLGRPPGPFKAVSSSMPDFFHFGGGSEIRTRDGVNHACFPGKLLVYPDSLHNISKWYARPVTLRVQALI
jgi:hypothetical protein